MHSLVPQRLLASGAAMPALGLGTFGSDHAPPGLVASAVATAVELGYRHIDCAAIYANEPEIGAALQRLFGRGFRREDLFLVSKLWNDQHGEQDVLPACRRTLEDLQLAWLDLYLVHWPFPNTHPPGCGVAARQETAQPYIHENFLRTWRQMEHLVELGLVRHIGVSNMTIPKLRRLLPEVRIRPAVNQIELHPHLQQPELLAYLRVERIEPVGYCPLGSPNRPDRDRTPEDTSPLVDPVIRRIAIAHGVHPAAACLKWAVQNGHTPIPFSTRHANIEANLRAVVEDPLTASEMEEMGRLDRNCRFIKGHVFLWKQGQSWEDLWDIHGEITPP